MPSDCQCSSQGETIVKVIDNPEATRRLKALVLEAEKLRAEVDALRNSLKRAEMTKDEIVKEVIIALRKV